jgi:hypothetical protein
MGGDANKPITYQADLTRLPRALAPLIERPQWGIWRWTQLPNGKIQKPPFMATQPNRHVSSTDLRTWSDYKTALAAVQAGHGDGISYVLTENDPFAAIDIDHCRHLETHSIEPFAQLFMQFAVTSYQEVTPSGEGIRIWGLANGAELHRKFDMEINNKDIAVELFRRTNKVLTISGCKLDSVREFTNIDKVLDWGIIACERRKAAVAANTTATNGHKFNSDGSGYSIDEIDQIVRDGAPAGANRSNLFHTIIGHFTGCGWPIEQIFEHLHQFRNGIGERYIAEDRLDLEISRSFRKWSDLPSLSPNELAKWTAEWRAKAPSSDPAHSDIGEAKVPPKPNKRNDPELEQDQEPDDDLDSDLDQDIDDDLDGDLDTDLNETPKDIGMTADALCAKVYEPPNYAVPGYIVEGLTLFAGKPKVGKSWLMLHAALAKARGAFTLGDVYCAKADVLYCALEDNKRRIQRRLNRLLKGDPAPKRLRILSAGEMPILSQGGTDLIRTWIEQALNPQLVVIDVLAKVRDPRRKDQGLYDSDYAALQGLKAIADEYGIAIVVIHHLRKMEADDPLDQVSCTTGLTGSVDTILVLNRTSSGTVLYGRGRDIEDVEKAIQFDPHTCTWTILGDASATRYTGERAAIIAVLKAAKGPMLLTDIAATSNTKPNNARRLLGKMICDGVVKRARRGEYELVLEVQK